MKRKVVFGFLVLIGLFTITGCGKKEEKENKKEKEYKNIYAVIEKYSSMDKSTKTYSDYTYDEKTGMITGYVEKEGSYKTTHKMTYDENNNLLTEEEIDDNTLTATYTYNNDNTVSKLTYTSTNENDINHGKVFEYRDYVKDDKGRVISYNTVNVTSDNYKMEYTFEYDDNDRVITETQTTVNSSYKIKYEYDENGNKIKETVYKGNSNTQAYYRTYKYDIIGKIEK